ncbi:MAG: histidine kinase, partial [Promicromonosporaceae bacterium]|nr:histidine kinase [Promicromonosporaceae bacterium]
MREQRRLLAIDAASAAAAGLVAILLAISLRGDLPLALPGRSQAPSGVIVAWSLLQIAPLAWRRAQPVWSTGAVAMVMLAQAAFGPLLLPANLMVFVALYSVTVYGPRWAGRAALTVALCGAQLLGLAVLFARGRPRSLAAAPVTESLAVAILASGLVLTAWAIGLARRGRVESVSALRERAHRLEVERDQQARLGAAAERTRIAREMHDIVAHSLTVMISQSDGGRYAATADPGAATRALEVIGETGRAALADMRRLLGVLREEGPANPKAPLPGTATGVAVRVPGSATAPGTRIGDDGRATGFAVEPAAIAAAPDDADLQTLVEQARSAGTPVSLVTIGSPRRLPPGMGLTLRRVCQEALTNARKYGDPSRPAQVSLTWPDGGLGPAAWELTLRVTSQVSPARTGPGEGYGLVGMRERAALVGGSVTAGRAADGSSWVVLLTIPVGDA